MRYLMMGSSLRGMADAMSLAVADGHEVLAFDAERPGVPESLANDVVVLPVEWAVGNLDGVDRVVTSPWFSERIPPLSDALVAGIEVVTEAAFGLEHLDIPSVAVTGTNGKTTVTEVTARMLRASGVDALEAGNIGRPVSSLKEGDASILVLELSSYQLRFFPRLELVAAALLNLAEDHLDWHGSMDAYVAAKARILNGGSDATYVYNADDPLVVSTVAGISGRVVPVSGTRVPPAGNGIEGDDLAIDGVRIPISTNDPTYRFDLAVAATLATVAGATVDGIREVASSFHPGQHRREHVGELGGVVYINDSKATNPHAAVAAASAYRSVVLLAGGRNKGLDLSPLTRIPTVKAIIAFGEAAPEIAVADASVVQVEGLRAAVDAAMAIAEPGDTVLLSPGCASFDEFGSYEERGSMFRKIVRDEIEAAA